jgi:hypothetical protein
MTLRCVRSNNNQTDPHKMRSFGFLSGSLGKHQVMRIGLRIAMLPRVCLRLVLVQTKVQQTNQYVNGPCVRDRWSVGGVKPPQLLRPGLTGKEGTGCF